MNKYCIFPEPKRIKINEGFFQTGKGFLSLLELYRKGMPLPAEIETAEVATDELAGNDEAYRIEITPERISVFAGSAAAVFYAVQTLRQLACRSSQHNLPCCEIEDVPDFKIRTVMLDVSRTRVPEIETLKFLIQKLAGWKINSFQLYTEHTFAYKGHEEVWSNSSAFSAEEIAEIKSFCDDYFISLVPNQNSFGHMERWFAHKRYHYLAECPEGFYDPWGVFREHSSTISPSAEGVDEFLNDLYSQLLPCFDSEYLNVGGDEPWELGKGRSRELSEDQGLDKVYYDFLMRLRGIAAGFGKKIQVYADIIMKYPHLIEKLPEDILLINWGYEAAHPFENECAAIAASGIPFSVCTGTSAWNSVGGRWLNAAENIRNGALQGLKNGAAGFMISEWGDNGHWQQFPVALPGFLYASCAAWNTASVESLDIEKAAADQLFSGNKYLAGALMRIQEVWACSKKALHNASLPALVLLDPIYPYYREDFKAFRGYSFAGEEALLDEAEKQLAAGALCSSAVNGGDSAPDNERNIDQNIDLSSAVNGSGIDLKAVNEELFFSIKLLRHGCRLGRLQFATENLLIREITPADRENLANELEPLIEEYKRLWLNRSRPGGLDESAGGFIRLLEEYRR